MKTTLWFVLFAGLTFLVSESCADWEYTKYGMTADEIVAASGGKARKLSDAEREGKSHSSESAIAASTHSTGPFDFDVIFYADKGGLNLKTVRLQLITKDQFETREKVAQLRNALTGKYGQPIDKRDEPGQFFTTKQWVWQGDADNILLQYLDGMNMAWIEYSQRLGELAL